MEDVVLSFRRRCAARRIAAGWQTYNNRKKLRQNLAAIRRCARNHIRRAAFLHENSVILATSLVDPTPAPTEPSVGGPESFRAIQRAMREVLTQAVLARDSDDEDILS
ncbi:uncharacterized protein LOC119095934 [Pollicipes pollicipes]|uniref:uncharacterized protein LOC119095934 n=1 Tax=Pollicipes pollicipes TaxID=41117 RepID=UPI0018858648|nr:uncharacterized protein LOC119095934 [Pollicipes pollicipes]